MPFLGIYMGVMGEGFIVFVFFVFLKLLLFVFSLYLPVCYKCECV